MIAERINHKGQCQHAQTAQARRVCRKATIAAHAPTAIKEAPVSRYSIGYVPGRYNKNTRRSGPQIEVAYDGNTEIYRTTAVGGAQAYIDRREASDAAPAAAPVTEPLPTGWSNAARRRAGTLVEHPLYGRGTHNPGEGFTTYEGGVQIWDHA